MNPKDVNALLTKTEPLTEDEKYTLTNLPFMELFVGTGFEFTPMGEPNREFLADLFLTYGFVSHRLSI